MAKRLIDATISLYDSCRGQLLPTPAKSHYVFNLRDVGRIVQARIYTNELLTNCLRIAYAAGPSTETQVCGGSVC